MYNADYWHHQMIYGVSSEGVDVTNGIETLSFEEILQGLVSPSELQVSSRYVLRCEPFDPEACDTLGPEWAEMKVTEQLHKLKAGTSFANYVYIPAAYRAGITIFAK